MSELVRSDNDLLTIRISLGRTSDSRSEVVFETVRGGNEALEVARCPASSLGLPDSSTGSSGTGEILESIQLPPHVIGALNTALPQLGNAQVPPYNAIWLELPSPRGYLYVLPWERMLEQLVRPVLRLPYHTLRPRASASNTEIAVCASAPSAKASYDVADAIWRVTGAWIANAPRQVTVHVFADLAVYDQLVPRLAVHGPAAAVHDPRLASPYVEPRRTRRVTEATTITSPWLQWMRDELQGRAVDAVHFVSHGYLSGWKGAIALASGPTINVDTRLARFVGAPELMAFTEQIGAWALLVSGPPGNFSPLGLRELADASARSRPGATVVHELGRDPQDIQLGQLLQLVLGDGVQSISAMPAVTCWVHPANVQYAVEEQSTLHLTESGHSALILEATQAAIASPDTPAWVAASARFLETQQSDWLQGAVGGEVDPAAASALQSVSAMLERHVNLRLPSGPESDS
jgi:hypothetical protein